MGVWTGIVLLGMLVLAVLAVYSNDIILIATVLVAYLFLAGGLFLYLPSVIFNFKPTGNKSVSLADLRRDITSYFSQNEAEGKMFDVTEEDDKMLITWEKQVYYNQVISVGGDSAKWIVVLRFHEDGRSIFMKMKKVSWDWNAGLSGLSFGGSRFSGIATEFSTRFKPSFEIVDGAPKLVVKNISYRTADMTDPVIMIASRDGWTLRVGLTEHKIWQRILFVLSAVALVSGLALSFFSY